MTDRSVLLASNYNVWREPFNGQSHAFVNVVKGIENADLMAPRGADYLAGHAVRPTLNYLFGEAYYRVISQMRRGVGRPSLSNMIPTKVEKNYDLFFFTCQFPQELASLDRMEGWRERSGTAICYLLETWSSSLPAIGPNLRMLDQFDHVFVLNAASIPALQRYTSTPISHLAPATDCAMASPMPRPPKRCIDVYSFGRRSPAIHAQLLAMSEESPDFFYMYDTIRGGTIGDWHEHRLLTASMMKHSKYFIAFNPSDIGGGAKGAFHKEQALSTRYFEGVAGGAVMLGSKPHCPEFDEHFDWPDAVIELDAHGDIRSLLEDLNGQQGRIEAASRRNVVESLRRHDWSHRWHSILTFLGLPASSALMERVESLKALSNTVL